MSVRLRCQSCGARVAVPGLPEPPSLMACPWCHIVGPAIVEPPDDNWWRWVTKQPEFGEIKKAIAAVGRAVSDAGEVGPSAKPTRRPAPPEQEQITPPRKRGEFRRQTPND